jgi:PRTRC genetic system ThiF family protein
MHATGKQLRLPHVLDLFPEIAAGTVLDDDVPSCSLAEALERQALFVNDAVVTQAKEILWRMFRTGQLEWHGAFINTRLGRVTPLAINPEAWARFNPALRSNTPKSRKGKL